MAVSYTHLDVYKRQPWTGGTTIFMIIGAFVFSNLLDECGLLRRISYWTIVKLGGSFTGMVFAVFLAGAILSLLTFNNGYMVEVFLAYSVCVTLKPVSYTHLKVKGGLCG